jgi:hypothetical protein
MRGEERKIEKRGLAICRRILGTRTGRRFGHGGSWRQVNELGQVKRVQLELSSTFFRRRANFYR